MKTPCFLSAFPALAAMALLSTPANARAEIIYGLTVSGALFSFDSTAPGTTSAQVPISGILPGQAIVGMDFRPATGGLYVLSYSSTDGTARLYTVDLTTAVATPLSASLAFPAGIAGSRFGFDFNPMVDRIRAIAIGGQNYRLHPNDGSLIAMDTSVAYAAGDVHVGATPSISGLAYSNNVAGTSVTTLYGFDWAIDSIATVGGANGSPSPNGGQLFTLGATGVVTNSASTDLDISAATQIAYANFDSSGTSADKFYAINLSNGAASSLGSIGAGLEVLDIAVPTLPTVIPFTIALTTPKKVKTTKAAFTIKGTVPLPGQAAYVEVKVGKAKYKKAKGTASWSFKVRLGPGTNNVIARAVKANGTKSAPVKLKIVQP